MYVVQADGSGKELQCMTVTSVLRFNFKVSLSDKSGILCQKRRREKESERVLGKEEAEERLRFKILDILRCSRRRVGAAGNGLGSSGLCCKTCHLPLWQAHCRLGLLHSDTPKLAKQ